MLTTLITIPLRYTRDIFKLKAAKVEPLPIWTFIDVVTVDHLTSQLLLAVAITILWVIIPVINSTSWQQCTSGKPSTQQFRHDSNLIKITWFHYTISHKVAINLNPFYVKCGLLGLSTGNVQTTKSAYSMHMEPLCSSWHGTQTQHKKGWHQHVNTLLPSQPYNHNVHTWLHHPYLFLSKHLKVGHLLSENALPTQKTNNYFISLH